MNNKEIESKIQKVVSDNTPNVLDAVLQECVKEKGKVIVMPQETKQVSLFPKFVVAFAVFALLFVSATYYNFTQRANRVAAVVSIDVNPSIQINVNEKDRVLAVIANNEDAKEIVGDMDFVGSDIRVTVNALIGSLVRHGYLSELSNSLLITVDDDNVERRDNLQQALLLEINEILKQDKLEGAILSQNNVNNNEIVQLAKEYDMSEAKAQLIKEIVTQNARYEFEDLKDLTINELNVINRNPLENVTKSGTASEKAYIGHDKAKEIALNHAGVKETDVYEIDVEFEVEQGIMVYEVEFETKAAEYGYDINAVDGTIVKSDREDKYVSPQPSNNSSTNTNTSTQNNTSTTNSTTKYISYDKAKEIALKHAGVSDIYDYEIELDDDYPVHYDIEFKSNGVEYDYEINAVDGSVIKSEKEAEYQSAKPATSNTSSNTPSTGTSTPSASTSTPTTSTATPSYIGNEKAKSIALNHAGVTNVTNYKIEFDNDYPAHYDIEFDANGFEYEYEINATNGNVIKSEKEALPQATKPAAQSTQASKPAQTQQAAQPATPSYIGNEKAKSIALSHAGANNATNVVVQLDDDGHYDVEFNANGFEYDYEVNATTGAVIKSEKEALPQATKPAQSTQTAKPAQTQQATQSTQAAKPAQTTQASKPAATSNIGNEKAKSIALNHAGVSNPTNLEVELDSAGHYDVSFQANGYEYDYEINATNGSIINSEKEVND